MNAEMTYLAFPNPVWEFEVHVALSVAKNVFNAHSAMKWDEFERKVLKSLDGVVLPVQLVYRVSGDTGKMSYLKDECHGRFVFAFILKSLSLDMISST